MDKLNLLDELRAHVKRKYGTQTGAAQMWGVSDAFVSSVLSGQKQPTVEILADAGIVREVIYRRAVPSSTASGELPPLPAPWKKLITRPGFDFTLEYFTFTQMREYGKACFAIGRGAAAREYVDNGTLSALAAVAARQSEPSKPFSDGARAMLGTTMPCGALVTNVYEAYEAGKKSVAARQAEPVDEQEPMAWKHTLPLVDEEQQVFNDDGKPFQLLDNWDEAFDEWMAHGGTLQGLYGGPIKAAAPAAKDDARFQNLLEAARETMQMHDEVTGGNDYYGYISPKLRGAVADLDDVE